MNKKFIIIAAVIFVLIIIACLIFSTRVAVNGTRITINSWGHHIVGVIKNEAEYRYVLKDQGASFGMFSGDGFVAAIAQERAEALRAKYGDFFKCSSPGAEDAIQSSQGIIFVARNSAVKNNISKALTGIKKNPTQAIFTAARIVVLKNTYFGLNVEDSTGTEIFYVKDFKTTGPFKP